ncbi:MAG: peptidoglycan recognition family protein [Candidatus Krumholzibacteriia bacterium]
MEGSTARRSRRAATAAVAMLAAAVLHSAAAPAAGAAKLRISDLYSPLNDGRPIRRSTELIVLHTSEGGDRSSLRRIRAGGLAHYVVARDGPVYRTIEKHREGRHAGLSMWNGKRDVDAISIGIEVVGHHNQPLTDAQVRALRELLRQLQALYRIPDERVVTHSMVAYGRTNRWHQGDHRGRKRCGMQFAQPELRARLGLHARAKSDPDVAAGRLMVADPFLATVLYGAADQAQMTVQRRFEAPDANVITAERTAWFIARDEYDSPRTVYVLPGGTRLPGDQVQDWSRIPAGTRVLLDQDPEPRLLARAPAWRVLGRDGHTAGEVAGAAYRSPTTVYVFPNGRVRPGSELHERDFRRLPRGTKVFVGFEYAGTVTPARTAYQLCGPSFRLPTTLYLFPGGSVQTGADIDESSIPGGTHVLRST